MSQINQIINQFNIPINEVIIAKNLQNNAQNIAKKYQAKKILAISDENLMPICANNIIKQINCDYLILNNPKANKKFLDQILHKINGHDLLIAIGSGTINDLCKLASFAKKIKFITFATAPSMNGYLSANVSIKISTHKTSLPAHLARGVYCDLDILQKAPQKLIQSGIGDSLCRSTCQFDWYLSNQILKTKYQQECFDILKPSEEKLYNNLQKNDQLVENLIENLLASGISMYIASGSYPASQAEHLVAHYLEILYPDQMEEIHHGQQIAITTLAINKIQEDLLKLKNLQLKPTNLQENYQKLNQIFSPKIADKFNKAIQRKAIGKNQIQEINLFLAENWPKIRNDLDKIHLKQQKLLKISQFFNLPQKFNDFNLENSIIDDALNNAHLIRDRFTIIDINKKI